VTAMPTNTSGYLHLADEQLDIVRRSLGTARRSAEPVQLAADIAIAQTSALQALAAAIDRLAAATESAATSRHFEDYAYNGQPAVPGYHTEGGPRTGEPAPSEAPPRRCSASTAKGTQCKLPAEPGYATCAIHAHQMTA
jgi:hypothetical protein